MAEVTASLVKELRGKTGAGMMDTKKALVENNGDIEAAIDWLRTKGLAKAAKKSGRTAAEGLVAVATNGTTGTVVELNSETDFVSRNEEFQGFLQKTVEIALNTKTIEELAAADFGDGKSVADSLTDFIARIGENMALRRSVNLSVSQGAVVQYVHGALVDGMGKIGVLVALESSAPNDVLQGLGKQIAMHVAAANPQFLDKNSVDSSAADRERSVLIEQAVASGKPQEIAEKMVEGRMRKYYEEVCLSEQVSMIDGENKIIDVVANVAKEAGVEIKLAAFARFQLGEGIEKKEEDFAAEVAQVANA